MTTHVRITDACPHCGGEIALMLAAAPVPAGGAGVAVVIDPASAALVPCPSAAPSSPTNPAGTAAVPEDHAS